MERRRPLAGTRCWLARLAILLAVTAMLTAMAPWNSYTLPTPQRAGYFLLCTLCCQAGLILSRRALERWAPRLAGARQIVAMVSCGTIAGAIGIRELGLLMFGHAAPFLPLYAQTLPVGLAVAFAYRGVFVPAAPVPTAGPSFPGRDAVPTPTES